MSEDGKHAIVVIAMLGSPFSPSYARAVARRKWVSPLRYCALNVALYGPRTTYFSLTERSVSAADLEPDSMTIGPNRIGWQAGALHVNFDERTSPWGTPLRGSVRLTPEGDAGSARQLDTDGEHLWWPAAPLAAIEVELTAPSVRFRGHGYHDVNAGDVHLGKSFARWSWARARIGAARAAVLYDTEDLSKNVSQLAFTIDRDGRQSPLEMPSSSRLPRTLWGLPRQLRSTGGVRVVRDLEDTPFYSRSLVGTTIEGREVIAMHEELSCTRLCSSWVQLLLGYRMGKG